MHEAENEILYYWDWGINKVVAAVNKIRWRIKVSLRTCIHNDWEIEKEHL
jgi:hypothetical protein